MAVLENNNWEKYCQKRAEGMTQRKAYLDAYPDSGKCKPATIDNKAYELEKKDEIKARIKELKEKAAGASVLTRQEKRELLAHMARDEKLSAADRQRAVDMDNKMEGEYETKISGALSMVKLEDVL